MMIHTIYIKTLGLIVSDKKIFSHFPYISVCKTCDPPVWGHFWPQRYNLIKLGRGPLSEAKYQAKYQISIV